MCAHTCDSRSVAAGLFSPSSFCSLVFPRGPYQVERKCRASGEIEKQVDGATSAIDKPNQTGKCRPAPALSPLSLGRRTRKHCSPIKTSEDERLPVIRALQRHPSRSDVGSASRPRDGFAAIREIKVERDKGNVKNPSDSFTFASSSPGWNESPIPVREVLQY